MTSLNNDRDSDYVAFHELVTKEFINGSYVETRRITEIQNGSFGTIRTYRPVIENSDNAVSFLLEYNLKLLNKVDNSQIIRRSQLISKEVKKYGKKMSRINLNKVPSVNKVYNKVVENTGKNIIVNNPVRSIKDSVQQPNVITQKEFVSLLADRKNIVVNSQPIKIETLRKDE
jgi:hypothetical protein